MPPEDKRSPDGPDVTLHTDEDGRVDTVMLGETTIVDDVEPGEDVDLAQAMYDAGFELTTRPLESFLTEVTVEDLDDDDPIKELVSGS